MQFGDRLGLIEPTRKRAVKPTPGRQIVGRDEALDRCETRQRDCRPSSLNVVCARLGGKMFDEQAWRKDEGAMNP